MEKDRLRCKNAWKTEWSNHLLKDEVRQRVMGKVFWAEKILGIESRLWRTFASIKANWEVILNVFSYKQQLILSSLFDLLHVLFKNYEVHDLTHIYSDGISFPTWTSTSFPDPQSMNNTFPLQNY